jgi:thiol-disulfide isomerase/thioredoxin
MNMGRRRTAVLVVSLAATTMIVALVAFSGPIGGGDAGNSSFDQNLSDDNLSAPGVGGMSWMKIELTDLLTNDTFRISDFEGRKVLVESFALWCPSCLYEQRHMQKLKQRIGDEVVYVSLDTDPNEDRPQIMSHVDKWGFDWLFAIAPQELTEALIDEFGLGILDAAKAPVILVCEDQSARLLRTGTKSADDLQEELSEGC